MIKTITRSSSYAKKMIISLLLFALPIVFLSQIKDDAHPLRADPVLASRTFTKESVATPTVYPESGFLLCDGVLPSEQFRFFYFSAAAQSLSTHLVTLQKDSVSGTPGTLMNMSVFNGLSTITVTFSGDGTPELFAKADRGLYEHFETGSYEALTSGVEIDLNPSLQDFGYVTIINDSETPVHIDSIKISYACTNNVDQYFYADENNHLSYARSAYGQLLQEPDQFMLMTNPTATTNNYAQGDYAGHPNKWYRWNGLALQNYRLDGDQLNWGATPFGEMVDDHIVVQMTAMIDPAIFYNDDAYFHLAPWIEIGDETHTSLGWIQSYMGNDNYDPIGGINIERTDTYRGRFFTNFDWNPNYFSEGSGAWAFQNPETTFVVGDPTTSLKDAYASNHLPFFNISFVIEGNSYKLIINDFMIYNSDAYFYETYTDQQYTIQQIHLQAVNYGHQGDPEADPAIALGQPLDPYFYGFTNPQIFTPVS